ncbi:YczE/YyaS/YitT family protein [Romboutsia sp. Marseille-P6047]|uniref:YczE/YyaS/YitT family protein n=1 Tax=Romboutsia sp. Marseille-P6047 TaxID=2161817 RepID=UPI000F061B29|nr:membrane protein [Romboutsia sp. Marseille-P6047]
MINKFNFKKKENIFRVLFYVVGLCIMGLGIALNAISNFGAGPWDAVNIGVSYHLNLSVGTCMNIVAVLNLIIGGILNKEFPKITPLITSLVLGVFVDLGFVVFNGINVSTSSMEFILFLISLPIISLGISIYLVSELPNTPLDYFMLAIKSKFKLSLMTGKIVSETSGLIIALLLGGPVGVGSIIIIFTIGPMMQFLFTYTKKYFNKLSKSNVIFANN